MWDSKQPEMVALAVFSFIKAVSHHFELFTTLTSICDQKYKMLHILKRMISIAN